MGINSKLKDKKLDQLELELYNLQILRSILGPIQPYLPKKYEPVKKELLPGLAECFRGFAESLHDLIEKGYHGSDSYPPLRKSILRSE